MLAAGLGLALSVAALQFFSPASRELMSGRDVRIALLGDRASALLVYHPFSSTVNTFTVSHRKARAGETGWRRAVALEQAAGGTVAGENIFFIALPSAPDMEALWGTLNNWRAQPRLLVPAVSWLFGLRSGSATNLSGFDLFCLTGEFSKLSSSNFILTDISRGTMEAEEREESKLLPAPMVEVFNASGRSGLAAATSKRLRSMGFDVITSKSYPTLEKQTMIHGFSSDTGVALKLREALGLEELEIHVKSSQKSVAGAAVILGRDFEPQKKGR
ncbi:MAG: hypothetical protein AUJ51_11845 [Elusimicrobia bacterium CG1_02_56_21]|nr:MAG: hypothetical protein AUJ51_11845 [Elusimicrobia bacterium CG1_02_56_21]